MNNSVNKNRVVLTILLVFSFTFFIFAYISYLDKKEDIKYIESNIKHRINNLYNEISATMLKKQLESRTIFMLERYNKDKKLIALKNKNKEELKKLFAVHYENLKDQIKGFHIMHFYDRDGISILRMHNPNKSGDKLTNYRNCVKSLVSNPRACSYFEVGMQGLAYRHTTPVYLKNELIGFFEIGVKPIMLIEKIKKIFDLKGYIFIKNQMLPKNIETGIVTLSSNGYSVCQFCSKKDEFISTNISKINLNSSEDDTMEYENKFYTRITKDIFDAQSHSLGKIVFFQDITLFKEQINNLIIKSVVLFFITSLIVYIILSRYINTIFKKLNKARFLLDNTNDAVYVVNLKDGKVMDVNERASLMLGFTKNELLSKKVSDFRTPIKGELPLDWNTHVNNLKLKHFLSSRGMHLKKDGTSFPVEANLSYVRDGEEEYMIAVARDITLQLEMEDKIKNKANELQRLQNVISKSVLYTTSDLNGKITSVSKAFENLSGYKESDLIGKNHSMFKNKDTSKEFYTNMWEVLNQDEQFVGEIKNYTKDKKEYWIKITIDPMFDENGIKIGYSSYRENITDKKDLEYISTHDTLTDIYNRGFFQTELNKKIKSAKRYNQNFGFIMLDIDHFKNVNDTYGHQVGDDVLVALSSCVQEHIREDDIFARWGGEEFVIIANGSDIQSLISLIEKIKLEISKISFNPVPKLTSSFGVTVYKDGDNIESIQKRADDALYKAKENGRDRYELVV